jgi:hypothetical protein
MKLIYQDLKHCKKELRRTWHKTEIEMKSLNQKFLVAVVLAASFTLNSCKKEAIQEHIDPVTITSQNEFVDMTYLEIQGIALTAIGSSDLSFKNESADALLGCATITRDTLSYPKTILVDFSNGCVYNNKTYTGSILVTYNNNNMRLAGSEANITFDNVTVDGNTILGNVKIKNHGNNANGNLYGEIDVLSNVTFTGNAGSINGIFHYDVERFVNNPNDYTDDHFLLNGSGSGVDAMGHSITRFVVQDLVRRAIADCIHFVSGQIRTEISGQPEQLLDYGSGTCDNFGTLTISGNSQQIVLE